MGSGGRAFGAPGLGGAILTNTTEIGTAILPLRSLIIPALRDVSPSAHRPGLRPRLTCPPDPAPSAHPGFQTANLRSGAGLLLALAALLALPVPAQAQTPAITIAAKAATVQEGEAAVFTLTRTGVTTAALTVTVAISESGSMVDGGDEGDKEATFGTGSATVDYSVPTQQDHTSETDSVVTATLKAGTGYTLGATAAATVTVEDHTVAVTVELEPDGSETPIKNLSVDEGDNLVLHFVATTGSDHPPTNYVKIFIFTREVTDGATAPADFGSFAPTAQFNVADFARENVGSGVMRYRATQEVTFRTKEDGLSEGDETLNVGLRATIEVITPTLIHGSNNVAAVVTIIDDDPAGAPTISGNEQVGQTLTASTNTITDPDGLTTVSYTYQWIRVNGTDADITGATSSTYVLQAADLGKTIKVQVTFDDDAGNTYSLTSDATGTVVERPPPPPGPCTGDTAPAGAVWTACLTVGTGGGSDVGYIPGGSGSLDPATFTVDGVSYTVGDITTNNPGLYLLFAGNVKAPPRAGRFHAGPDTFYLAGAFGNIAYFWQTGAPSWSIDDKVTVALVETLPRVAVAAAPSTVDPGGSARLTATARDPDGGSIVSYEWSQTSGPEGRFDRTDGATATWTAPKPVEVENPNVEIQVVVTDDEGETATGAVTIAVSNPTYSVRYSGQQHSQAWQYYTGDSRTRGQPEITVSTLAGVPILICGNDGVINGGLYCGDGVNHEWASVDASLSGSGGGTDPEPPLLPGLTVTPALAALEVSWDTVPATMNYLVLWKSGGQAYAAERRATVVPPTTSYTITGLRGGTEYTVKVRAFSVETEEAEATGIPLSPEPPPPPPPDPEPDLAPSFGAAAVAD